MCNSIIPYQVRSYLFLKAKNAVFMRLVAFRKRLINVAKREEKKDVEAGMAQSVQK